TGRSTTLICSAAKAGNVRSVAASAAMRPMLIFMVSPVGCVELFAVSAPAFFAIIARRMIFASRADRGGAAMLTSEVLPLIREAANRVYSVVRETPLAALARHA